MQLVTGRGELALSTYSTPRRWGVSSQSIGGVWERSPWIRLEPRPLCECGVEGSGRPLTLQAQWMCRCCWMAPGAALVPHRAAQVRG